MSKVVWIARVLMGLPLVVFGLNTFLMFFEPPKEGMPPGAMAWSEAMVATGYLTELMGGVMLLSGVLLLTGRLVPFALVIFAPVLVNICAFHLFLTPPSDGIPGFVLLALELFLAWAYGPHFRGLLTLNARPRGSD